MKLLTQASNDFIRYASLYGGEYPFFQTGDIKADREARDQRTVPHPLSK
jgi:hypothetical protein